MKGSQQAWSNRGARSIPLAYFGSCRCPYRHLYSRCFLLDRRGVLPPQIGCIGHRPRLRFGDGGGEGSSGAMAPAEDSEAAASAPEVRHGYSEGGGGSMQRQALFQLTEVLHRQRLQLSRATFKGRVVLYTDRFEFLRGSRFEVVLPSLRVNGTCGRRLRISRKATRHGYRIVSLGVNRMVVHHCISCALNHQAASKEASSCARPAFAMKCLS